MAGEVRGEEQNRVGDLLWTGDFPQRNAEFKLLAKAANTPLFFGVIAHHSVRCIGVGGASETTLQRTPLPASSSPTLNAGFSAPLSMRHKHSCQYAACARRRTPQ